MSGQIIECPCGTVLRSEHVAGVVAEAQAHALAVHDLELSNEQATAMARPT